MRGIACIAGFFLPVILIAADAAPWWQELARIGLDNRKGNEEVLVVCDTPEKLAELFIERTQLDIWNKHHNFNLGANWPERLARKYLDHCPADIKPKAQVLFRSPVTKETASGIREWFYLDQARKRAELARKTVEFVRANKGKVAADQLAELTAVETAVQNALSVTNVPTGGDLFRRAYAVRRAILFTHPKLRFEKLLVNKNPPTTYPHNCDQYLGRHSRVGPGLTVLTDWQSGSPKQKVLCEGTLPPGAYSKPALSYDGKKIAFAYADHTPATNALRRFFLYEVGVNGKGLRQLTGTSRDKFETWYDRQTVMIEDCDPRYLPDGGLAFVSTRAQCFGRCHGRRYTPSLLLYRCDEDGDDIRQLSFGSENETTPSVLPDGRILFTRWEYIDRHEMEFHKLWWKRPDGTMISHYYGNDTIYPLMISEALPVPGTTKVMANGTGHHNFHAGTVMLIDTAKGENGPDPVTRMTPEVKYPESDECGYGTGGHYCTPYPIDEHLFFASYSPTSVWGQGSRPPDKPWAIFLCDDLGGREPIFVDPQNACFSPIPIVARERPPVLPSALPRKPKGEDAQSGVYMIQDVNLTRNDPEKILKRGQIKHLRFNEILPKPIVEGPRPSGAVWNGAPKRLLGTVPVEPDGSVVVRVPSGVPLQIQALDENFMAVMTERSFHYLHPGERRGCVGCHEPLGTSLKPDSSLFTRKPKSLTPPVGQNDGLGLSFLKMVQPVLDKNCIGCHDVGPDSAKNKMHLVSNPGKGFPAAYGRLRGYASYIGNKNDTHGLEKNISRPMDYYAHASRLIPILKNAPQHKSLRLSQDEWVRIISWLDLNAQAFGDFSVNRPEYAAMDKDGEKALRDAVRERFGGSLANQPIGSLVNVASQAESRILMGPLAVEAGGWGQIENGWKSKDDPEFKRFAELVRKAVVYPHPDIRGTCGNDPCACSSCWVRAMKLNEPKRHE